ncbi:MAG TPA: DUF2877 domain-containing protein, partial [Actinomycetes bacterium]|nr:DUF2877 domain-containing protein [Actinomycetes bacterium]
MVTLPAHLVATPVLERLAADRRREGPESRDGELEGMVLGAGPHRPTGELEGVVLGAGATAAWVDLDGFVIAITTREVPLLPNAIALAAGSGALAGAGAGSGATARLAPGRVTLGPLQVTWDPTAPPSWDPTVPVPAGATRQAVSARGAALLRALGAERAVDNQEHARSRPATLPHRGPTQPAGAEAHVPSAEAHLPSAEAHLPGPEAHLPGRQPDPEVDRELVRPSVRPSVRPLDRPLDRELVQHLVHELGRIGLATAVDPEGAAGLTLLFRGIQQRDPEPAAAGARELLGRGPGLTPEGDDLLAAVAGTVAVLGPAAGMGRSFLRRVLAALVDPAPERTTTLSATLLELAARG